MLITRTPLRISLGGGGTDLPSYYEASGSGFLVAAAINKYVYIAVHDNFVDRYLIKYSQIEDVEYAHEIVHPLIREAITLTETDPGVEITSIADIPAGTGLGSSGTFTVGLLKALYARRHKHVSNLEIAQQACHLEIDRLREPIGKQDQYIAAVGGLTSFTFHPDGKVDTESLTMDPLARKDLNEHLVLFYTGIQRRASDELTALHEGASVLDSSIRANLDIVRDLGRRSAAVLERGELDAFGRLLTEQWQLKFERSPTSIHQKIDGWLSAGIQAGAHGGKLVGAGGGGFLLFLAEDKFLVRRAMRDLGLREIDFSIDYDGSRTML